MTTFLVIATAVPRPDFVKRRYDPYGEFASGARRCYFREDHGPTRLVEYADDDLIRPLAPLIADLHAVRDDPDAIFFAVLPKRRETLAEFIARGLALPRGAPGVPWVRLDAESQLASEFGK